MYKTMMKSKIHRARVTESNLHYEGSITIDEALMEQADILPYEQVQIYNVTNGERFTTYAITGEKNSGVICINGAAAHKAKKDDLIIIVTYASYDEKELATFKPKKVYVDDNNKVKNQLRLVN
ncbi:MAG TPA: aspartate 1-decarboxylase [Syntrophorhabdaceae bacterium]|nr:aspartate 1-decarboxylase [Syntrophorhabdaceae bacterium]HOL06000.1 aspartate 1-decarboxylase [Syntrophorhabdaceae bacterium]HON85413.1 aspartate 1-decarboxylase [Syntrophorhabdaceae bacterium]HOT42273.1 aspartate 1-decarboxylase [Syntrophorhabdaceae bacterium]HPC66988.1 aspartate 1-decarboxylase [Syntrophorhabdaceae bacterium]